jgi:hypothetical protein
LPFMEKMGFDRSSSGKDRMMLAKGLFNYVCPKVCWFMSTLCNLAHSY